MKRQFWNKVLVYYALALNGVSVKGRVSYPWGLFKSVEETPQAPVYVFWNGDVEVPIKCKYDRVDLYLLNFYWFRSVIERCLIQVRQN